MTRARNIAGFSTITTTPSPVHVGPIGVLTATRIDGEFNVVDIATRDLTAQGIGVTNLQVSGITTGLNVSGIITAQNGINFNGTSTGLNVSGVGTIATLSVTGNATVGGVLTYEDVTRVDSVGVITAREQVHVGTGVSIAAGGLNVTAGISTFGGDVSIADKIVHTGDTNTAIRFPATDEITAETGGNERIRITSTGTVLKGLTSARSNYANNTSGVEYGFQIESTNATKSSISLIRSSDDANDGGIFLGKTRGSVGGNTVVQAGDDLGTIVFGGADGTSLQFGAEIGAEVQSGVGNDDMPTSIFFKTNGGSTSTAERMRLDQSGRLLIGTATTKSAGSGQYAKLNVEGYAGGTECFASFSRAEAASAMSNNDEVANLTFNDSAGYEFARIQVLADAATGATDTPGRLVFRTTADSASSSTERMRISNDGRITMNSTGTQPSSSVSGLQLDNDGATLRLMAGAGASGTTTASLAIGGSNHNASIENGANSGGALNLYNYNSNTGNSTAVSFHNKNGLSSARILGLNIDHDNRDGGLVFMVADGSHPTEAARIIQSKNIGIQASTNINNRVEIGGGSHYTVANSGQARNGIHIRGQVGNSGEFGGGISFSCNPNGGDNGAAAIAAEQMSSDGDVVGLAFFTHETSGGSDNAEQKLRISSTGGLFMMNQENNRGYVFDSTSGSRPTEANVQGSQGTGIIAAKKDNIAQNTVTKLGDSHWGGLAWVGYSGTGHQGYRLVAYGYGGSGVQTLFSGNWVGSLTTTFSMSTYELRVSHNASNALNFWLINIGV